MPSPTATAMAGLTAGLLLANIKSLPFAWHIRLIYHYLPRHILQRLLHRPTLAPEANPKDPLSLFRVTRQTFTNSPGESDYHMHMNNANYYIISDMVRTSHNHLVIPKICLATTTLKHIIAHTATSARYIREIPIFARYSVYTRILTWSDDGLCLYYQLVFMKKGVPRDVVEGIPSDEVVCAVLYVRNQSLWRDRSRGKWGDIFKEEGYDVDDDEVRKCKAEGWEIFTCHVGDERADEWITTVRSEVVG